MSSFLPATPSTSTTAAAPARWLSADHRRSGLGLPPRWSVVFIKNKLMHGKILSVHCKNDRGRDFGVSKVPPLQLRKLITFRSTPNEAIHYRCRFAKDNLHLILDVYRRSLDKTVTMSCYDLAICTWIAKEDGMYFKKGIDEIFAMRWKH
ncbi:Plant self-incompatibility S1 [Corchorus olitorius]|uniref:Plant self-incompatibility S1 n=1 Tax=Corchorus olitorius TaxID=93759 RepID=A0A1R3I1Z0_9ROSI|nr:Plant self-incompatibility S1 [Corchorus olitorius]